MRELLPAGFDAGNYAQSRFVTASTSPDFGQDSRAIFDRGAPTATVDGSSVTVDFLYTHMVQGFSRIDSGTDSSVNMMRPGTVRLEYRGSVVWGPQPLGNEGNPYFTGPAGTFSADLGNHLNSQGYVGGGADSLTDAHEKDLGAQATGVVSDTEANFAPSELKLIITDNDTGGAGADTLVCSFEFAPEPEPLPPPADPRSRVRSLTASSKATAMIRDDGSFWYAGQINYGVAGLGFVEGLPYNSSGVASPGVDVSPFRSVRFGRASANAVAVGSNGTVWTWGVYGLDEEPLAPTHVPGLTDVVDAWPVELGFLAQKADGTVWGYGRNSEPLGLGDNRSVYTPEQVPNLMNVRSVHDGSFATAVILTDGTVMGSGIRPGDGTPDSYSSFRAVPGLSDVVDLALPYSSVLALKSDGSLLFWGYNAADEAAGAVPSDGVATAPTPVASAPAGLVQIEAGENCVLARDSSGGVWGWGSNGYGQLFDRSDPAPPSQTATPTLTMLGPADDLACGARHVSVRRKDCSIVSQGRNYDGELGNGYVGEFGFAASMMTTKPPGQTYLLDYDANLQLVPVFSNPPTMPFGLCPTGCGPDGVCGTGDDPQPDGKPPVALPIPPPVNPVSGGCKASLDGPSGCNWVVPPDAFPPDPNLPEDPDFPDLPRLPMPGDEFGGFPIDRVRMPDMPPLDCRMPDFGNSAPCAPFPGMGGSLPGGWDSEGNIGGIGDSGGGLGTGDDFGGSPGGSVGGIPIHTKGPTTDAREKSTFDKKTCFPPGSSAMASITQLLTEAGINPIKIVFEIGPEWDKTFSRCFDKGTRKWDAAAWIAEFISCIIIDEGDGNVYIGPPFIRPGQRTHVFSENVDLFVMDRTSDSQDAYYAVEVYGGRVDPPVIAFVEAPFSVEPENVLRIQVGPNYSRQDAASLAALRAGQIRQSLAGIQVSVPFSEDYYMRDKMLIRAPSRGVQETYIIVAKQSDISVSGHISILSGLLPATLATLQAMPDVLEGI